MKAADGIDSNWACQGSRRLNTKGRFTKEAIYHVMNCGDRREPIVLTDEDREVFVHTLAQTCDMDISEPSPPQKFTQK